MKTKEELSALKSEIEALGKKLAALTDDELKQVNGGDDMPKIKDDERYIMGAFRIPDGPADYEFRIYKARKNQQ